jgi:hypothetical protein
MGILDCTVVISQSRDGSQSNYLTFRVFPVCYEFATRTRALVAGGVCFMLAKFQEFLNLMKIDIVTDTFAPDVAKSSRSWNVTTRM